MTWHVTSLTELLRVQDLLIHTSNTRAALGNTVLTDGAITGISLVGTGDTELPPPTVAQPPVGGNYNGYMELLGLSMILESGGVNVVGAEFVIAEGGGGDYETPHAWLDISADSNNTVVGFVFGILKASDNMLYFSSRVTGERSSAQDQPTNISGGGFISNLEEGDKISVWVAASNNCDLTIYDGNIGLKMTLSEKLK